MQDQIVVLDELLRFKFPIRIQLLLRDVFTGDEVPNIADEIVYLPGHLLQDRA
jgi:hypothetical protein